MGTELYRYDLHVHTAEVSACAKGSAADMAEMYQREGYTGIVITDHFFNGNTTVPRELPWEERVHMLKTGFEHAKKRGDEIGLDVFYGWEYTFGRGTDFLTLGLDSDWLISNPDVCELDITEYMNRVHEAGGYIIHAHPFLEAYWVPYIRLLPRYEDAVEIINAPGTQFMNDRAADYAKAYDLTVSAGSDAHDPNWKCFGGIETIRRMESICDLVETMKKREHRVFTYQK
jgi:histidinol phosphatase-like PHP family hydrolase